MASGKPVVRQVSWISIIPLLILMAILIVVFRLIFENRVIAMYVGILAYLVIVLLVRNLIPFNHRKGYRLFKQDRYEEAIAEFEKSFEFFSNHLWLDKYRYIFILSSSRISYREMALNNTAYCYMQMGNSAKAKEYYNKALEIFPDSQIAKASLQFIKSAEKGAAEESGAK